MFHVKHLSVYFIFIIFSKKVTYISIFNTCRIHIDYDLHILCTIIYYTPFLEKVYLPPIYFFPNYQSIYILISIILENQLVLYRLYLIHCFYTQFLAKPN